LVSRKKGKRKSRGKKRRRLGKKVKGKRRKEITQRRPKMHGREKGERK